MKKLILRALVFLSIVAIVLGGICAIEVYFELRQYYGSEVVMPETASIVVCSDSQTDMGVDPGVCPAFFNFSAHGRLMDQNYLALIDILRSNPGKVKCIVVDVTPPSLVADYDKPLAEMVYSSKYYLLHWLHFNENMRSMKGILPVFRDNMVGRRLRLFSRSLRGVKKFESSINGGYVREYDSLLKSNPTRYRWLREVKVDQVKDIGRARLTDPVFCVLDAIVSLADKHGIQIVFITTPWRSDLRELCGEESLSHFTMVVDQYARSRKCPYLSFLSHQYSDDKWFDCNHLNTHGAAEFTRLLYCAITNLPVVVTEPNVNSDECVDQGAIRD